MPRFLIQATFNQEAAKRLIEDGGTKRAAAVKKLVEQQEGRLENLYFSPQNDGPDAFAIVEMTAGGADGLRGYSFSREDDRNYLNGETDIHAGGARQGS